MKQSKFLVILLVLGVCSTLSAQKSSKRTPYIPNTKDFVVLKFDPHTHTVFSDGLVWPTVRINEAVNDGTDVIAISDHIEYRPYLKDLGDMSHNRSYELVRDLAAAKNVILIKASEITRSLPPGHFNALFIKDADAFEKFSKEDPKREGANIKQTLKEAYNQGGIVMWNHPSWPRGYSELFDVHKELFKEGLVDAIEVVNGKKYSPQALDWAQEYSLAVLGSSDVHDAMDYETGGFGYGYRGFTIVLAKEKTAQGVREAIDGRRTLAVQDNSIFGSDKNLKLIIPELVTYTYSGDERSGALVFENRSGFSFEFELSAGSKFKCPKKVTLLPHSKTSVAIGAATKDYSIPANCKMDVTVKNAWRSSKENFVYQVAF